MSSFKEVKLMLAEKVKENIALKAQLETGKNLNKKEIGNKDRQAE